MKPIIRRIAAAFLCAAVFSGAAPGLSGVLDISAHAEENGGWTLWKQFDGECSLTAYEDDGCSVALTNEDYNISIARKTFPLEKDTHYIFSAQVLYEDCEISPDATIPAEGSGARLGKALVGYDNGCYNGSEWKQMTYEFDSGDSTFIELGLYNGVKTALCKGTAYFSDIKLEPVYPWDSTYQYNKSSGVTFSVDKKNVHADAEYSISITNEDFNVSYATVTFDVEPDTNYRVSAWVKCSGYELRDDFTDKSGACISIPGNTVDGKYHEATNLARKYSGSKWEKLEFEFTSGNETTYDIALYNGMWYADSKGTVYFSGFTLEKCEPVTDWNVLAVIFTSVKAPIEKNGQQVTFRGALNTADVKYLTAAFEDMYTSVPILSEGRWGINSIDIYTEKSPVTELRYDSVREGYSIDSYSSSVSKVLDKYIEKAEKQCGKKYDQIIVVSPITDIAKFWSGLTSAKYKSINFCQANYKSGSKSFTYEGTWKKAFPSATFVHEMLHCAERHSRDDLNITTPELHIYLNNESYKEVYAGGQKSWADLGAFYTDYIIGSTPDGQKIDERAFYVYRNGTVVYGTPVTDEYAKLDISKADVSEIGAMTYTGSPVKPKVTVRYNGKTLKSGSDYTVKYISNKGVGQAAVLITGKGRYFGNIAKTFEIIPQKPSLSVKKSGTNYTLSWSKAKGAETYEIYYSTNNGKSFRLLKKIDGSSRSTTVSLKSGKKYSFRIRSSYEIYPVHFNSGFSDIVKA